MRLTGSIMTGYKFNLLIEGKRHIKALIIDTKNSIA